MTSENPDPLWDPSQEEIDLPDAPEEKGFRAVDVWNIICQHPGMTQAMSNIGYVKIKLPADEQKVIDARLNLILTDAVSSQDITVQVGQLYELQRYAENRYRSICSDADNHQPSRLSIAPTLIPPPHKKGRIVYGIRGRLLNRLRRISLKRSRNR
jgi:hypothetical protein